MTSHPSSSATAPEPPRGPAIAAFVAGAADRPLPPEVVEAAKLALVDHLGVALGAVHEGAADSVRAVARAWGGQGNARMYLAETTTPALAALVNGTMAHCMDYDDTHPGGTGHPSGPAWGATLAVAAHRGLGAEQALRAFVAGFEVMARLGGGSYSGVGRGLQQRGLHPTSVFGRMAAACATAVLLGLDAERTAHALGVAATTAGGLLGSFGTMSKPFHAGKAGMDGVLAAEMAAEGFQAATHLLERQGGLLDAFIQDGKVEVVPPMDFADHWELLSNGYKPFACCRATQPSTQAARSLAGELAGREVRAVRARVHPNALITAGKLNPQTPLEGKFSVPFCIALGLSGYAAVAPDFSPRTIGDPALRALMGRVELEAVPGQDGRTAALEVTLADGSVLRATTETVIGHPLNPMSWDDMHTKFMGLLEPVLGAADADALFEAARQFDAPDGLERVLALIGPRPGV